MALSLGWRALLRLAWMAPLLACAVAAQARAPDLDQALAAYARADDRMFHAPGSSRAKAARHSRYYEAHFGRYLRHGELATLDAVDAQRHFDALARVVTYTNDARQVALMRDVYQRLLAVDGVRARDAQTLDRALLAVRDAESAAAVHSGEALPQFVRLAPGMAAGDTVWRADPPQRRLTQTPFVLPRGPYIVVYASPHCHFSRDAVAAIAQDADLARRFAGRSSFLVPPDASFGYDALQTWNGDHPEAAMALIHSLYDRPERSHWNTPTFYFYRDRKLVATVEGWPAAGNGPALKAAMARIGLR